MIGFSEVDVDVGVDVDNDAFDDHISDMSGGMSEDDLHKISRVTINQKNKFHEEAIEKILELLPTKDQMTARAVKAIIYDEIKQTKQNLSGLDRAAELLKAVTKKKVEEVLKQKDQIKKIIEHIEAKNKERDSNPKGKDNTSKEKGRKDRRKDADDESSVSESSYYDSSDSGGAVTSSPIKQADEEESRKSSKTTNKRNYFNF